MKLSARYYAECERQIAKAETAHMNGNKADYMAALNAAYIAADIAEKLERKGK